METIIAQITENEEQNQKIYEQASDILKRGGLVAFPTETVYGLRSEERRVGKECRSRWSPYH